MCHGLLLLMLCVMHAFFSLSELVTVPLSSVLPSPRLAVPLYHQLHARVLFSFVRSILCTLSISTILVGRVQLGGVSTAFPPS